MAGYFNDPVKAAAAVVNTIVAGPAVYVTLNAVQPDLLARAANRLAAQGKKGGTTQDSHIPRRINLLIDCDAIRPSGISSSALEFEAARQKAMAVRESLAIEGWPAPILAQSGNGWHLLYRVDLPAEDEHLVENLLKALSAEFTDASVKIDTSVFNPSRITKLYGTPVRKGDDLPERPHRMSRFVETPAVLEVVPTEKLRAVADRAPKAEPPPHTARSPFNNSPPAAPFDVAGFIARNNLGVDGPEAWTDHGGPAQRWVFYVCPMNPDHTNASAFILQHNSGAVSAGCHHDSCKHKWGWKELRGKYEPRTPHPTPPRISPPSRPSMASPSANGQPAPTPATGLDVTSPTMPEKCPMTGKWILTPSQTLPTAKAFLSEKYTHEDGPTLYSYAGMLINWQGNRFVEMEEEAAKHHIMPWLHNALQWKKDTQVQFHANPTTVNATLETIRSVNHLPATTVAPHWLNYFADQPPASEILPCKTTLLHLPTMQELDPTPAFFTFNALDFDYDPKAPSPTEWLAFLDQLFPSDPDSIRLLQTWAGYCLTGDTSQQKMMLLVGAKRSGKGTIGRILTRLVGAGNVAGPTTGGLAGVFGLQPLIGKSLAIVSDARFSGENTGIVVERLLCISGEDALTIDRKYLGAVTMRLPTRFMFLSNEVPKLTESSGALAGRFLVLKFSQSFYGREDLQLESRLIAELPGILRWAVQGWHILREQRRFIEPASGLEIKEDMEDLLSPVGAWVRDKCLVEPEGRAWMADLFTSWKDWCLTCGREHPGTIQTFGRELGTAVPTMKVRKNNTRGRFVEGLTLAH